MNDLELFEAAHQSLNREARACTDPERRAWLERASAFMWCKVLDARRQKDAQKTWVFDCSNPGYITLGEQGEEQIHQAPSLPGLLDAWHIFAWGVGAGGILHATDFVGNVGHPANALRNRLARAAQWVEDAACCPAIAQALRSPAISVMADGALHIGPRPHIELMA